VQLVGIGDGRNKNCLFNRKDSEKSQRTRGAGNMKNIMYEEGCEAYSEIPGLDGS
jgi:hypothetical protein